MSFCACQDKMHISGDNAYAEDSRFSFMGRNADNSANVSL